MGQKQNNKKIKQQQNQIKQQQKQHNQTNIYHNTSQLPLIQNIPNQIIQQISIEQKQSQQQKIQIDIKQQQKRQLEQQSRKKQEQKQRYNHRQMLMIKMRHQQFGRQRFQRPNFMSQKDQIMQIIQLRKNMFSNQYQNLCNNYITTKNISIIKLGISNEASLSKKQLSLNNLISKNNRPHLNNSLNIKFLNFFNKIQSKVIKENYNWPYSCFGLVRVKVQQQKYLYGTGVLVARNIILTSAQNIYNQKQKNIFNSIDFIPSLCEGSYSKIYQIKNLFFPDQYISHLDLQKQNPYNYALLNINIDLDQLYGFIEIAEQNFHDQNTEIFILGYSSLQDNQISFIQTKGRYSFYNSMIKYINFETLPGMSGSPVVIKDRNDNLKIIGINCNNNFGIYFSKQKKQNILLKASIPVTEINFNDKRAGNNIIQYLLKKVNLIRNNNLIMNLQNNMISSQGCKKLTQLSLENLIFLNLKSNSISSTGCQYLKNIKFSNLRQIYFDNNHIGKQGADFFKLIYWPNLKILSLTNTSIQKQGCNSVAQINNPSIVELRININNISDIGCFNLQNNLLKNIMILNIQRNGISSNGIKNLIGVDWINLKSLNLSSNEVDTQGLNYLKDCNFPNLRSLELFSNNITTTSCSVFKLSSWVKLQYLDLSSNIIKDEGLLHLIYLWPNLKQLRLMNTGLQQSYCEYLKFCVWKKLQVLHLSLNQLKYNNSKHLRDTDFPRLKQLFLISIAMCDRTRYIIRNKWKKIKIQNGLH